MQWFFFFLVMQLVCRTCGIICGIKEDFYLQHMDGQPASQPYVVCCYWIFIYFLLFSSPLFLSLIFWYLFLDIVAASLVSNCATQLFIYFFCFCLLFNSNQPPHSFYSYSQVKNKNKKKFCGQQILV